MNQRIRAQIQPFQHDNRIQDIVAHIAEINANLHALEAELSLPRMPIPARYPINAKAWRGHGFGTNARAKRNSKYGHVKASQHVINHAHEIYRF